MKLWFSEHGITPDKVDLMGMGTINKLQKAFARKNEKIRLENKRAKRKGSSKW